MNKLKIIIYIMAVSSIVMSCNKNDVNVIDTPSDYTIERSKTKDGANFSWLNFQSLQALESRIAFLEYLEETRNGDLSSFDSTSSYISFRAYTPEYVRDTAGLIDDVLMALINPDGVIQVAG